MYSGDVTRIRKATTASVNFADLLNDIPTSKAVRAYEMTSSIPQRRAYGERRDYALMLAQDLDDFRELADSHDTASILDMLFPVYRSHLKKVKLKYLTALARCSSGEVTDSVHLQFQRAGKRAALARKRRQQVSAVRNAWRKRLLKVLNPDVFETPDSPFERQRLEQCLDAAKARQKKMQGINATLRRLEDASHEQRLAAVAAFGISPGTAELLVTPGDCGVMGFGAYWLANATGEIRRLETRLARFGQVIG